MLLTITTDHHPATDLGHLLRKHPDRAFETDLPFGRAHVVWPEAGPDRATAALLVEVDPVGLVRPAGRGATPLLTDYVNDRPYAASSFLSVALRTCFGSALAGRSPERPDLVDRPLPLTVGLPAVPCRGGEAVLHRLFEPLGYQVDADRLPLDAAFPEWGDSRYLSVRLTGTVPVRTMLEHLFVLLPVLDDDKHYWVGPDEIDKLLRRAGDWLGSHPDRQLITERYLRHNRRLVDDALGRLVADTGSDPAAVAAAGDDEEAATERPLSLGELRLLAVVGVVRDAEASSVVDLGCGEGRLVRRLLSDTDVGRIVGVDVSIRALEVASRRLHLDTMAPRQRERVELRQGALTYRDRDLAGFDVATVLEVVEHLDPGRLGAFERVVFAHARPRRVVLTTPNAEYNVRFEGMAPGAMRHRDHRFEWTRAELADWAGAVADRHGYRVAHSGIGPDDAEVGAPTQMAVFDR